MKLAPLAFSDSLAAELGALCHTTVYIMGEHRLKQRRYRLNLAAVGRETLLGALAGGALGALLIAVGLLRALAYVIAGRTVAAPSSAELHSLAVYVAGFSCGGATVGLLRRLPAPGQRYIAYAIGGMVALVGVMLAFEGGQQPDSLEIVIFACMGLIVGLAVAAKER